MADALVADLEQFVTDSKKALARKDYLKKKDEVDGLRTQINSVIDAQKNDIDIMKRRLPQLTKTVQILTDEVSDKKIKDAIVAFYNATMIEVNHTETADKIDDK